MTPAYVSTACLRDRRGIVERVGHLLRHGFSRVELGSALPCTEADLDALRVSGGTFLVHNYFPAPAEPFVLDLASADAATLGASRDLCRGAIDLSASFGAPFYSVHAGLRAKVIPGTLGRELGYGPIAPYEDAYARFVASIGELCAHAERRGIAIAVEPHVVARFNLVDGRNDLLLMCRSDELRRLFADVGAANLGVLVDVGHLNVTATTLGFDRVGFIDDLAGRVLAFHLHDNDGLVDQHRPFDEAAWFLPVLAGFGRTARILECHVSDLDELRRCADLASRGADA